MANWAGFQKLRKGRIHIFCPSCGRKQSNAAGRRQAVIIYTYAIEEADGSSEWPCVAWRTAEEARAAAVSFLADRLIAGGEADDMLSWAEDHDRSDGKYPVFTAPTKYGRTVRVWPLEIIEAEVREGDEK